MGQIRVADWVSFPLPMTAAPCSRRLRMYQRAGRDIAEATMLAFTIFAALTALVLLAGWVCEWRLF